MKNRLLAMLMAMFFLTAMVSPVLAAPMHQGRPTAYDSGSSAGYYVWQEGNRWQVQTLNSGTQHSYSGMIETDGEFSDVSILPSEKVQRVAVNVKNDKIDFHFNSHSKTDGFSFTLRNSRNAKFTLYIDGQPVDPSNIYMGNQNRHPNSHSFPIDNIDNDSFNQSRFQGRPTAFNPGNVLGYFIWQDGDRWILKTTTRGAQRQFSGTIRTSGTFESVSRIDRENNDSIRLNGANDEINFNLKTEGDQDGLSFRLNRSENATFSLNVDGQPINVSNIYLGAQNLRPNTNPFSINSRNDQYTTHDHRGFPTDDRTGNLPYETTNQSRFQGQPTALNPGNVFGYFLWQEQNRWFLQTSTTGAERQFTGIIETNGTFSDVKTVRSLRSDGALVDAASNRINFAFKTGGSSTGISLSIESGLRFNQTDKVSGLSFFVSDGANLNIRLSVDGQPVDPAYIFIGSGNRHPSNSSLRVNSQNR